MTDNQKNLIIAATLSAPSTRTMLLRELAIATTPFDLSYEVVYSMFAFNIIGGLDYPDVIKYFKL
jgi:hypothetical protein